MAYEIELKAHVADAARTAERLNGCARFLFHYEKEDVYWYNSGAAFPSGVRVRTECRTTAAGAHERFTLVTYKRQEQRDGIEVNEEREFRVAPPGSAPEADGETAAAAFRELLTRAGFTAGFTKKKRGSCWRYTPPAAAADTAGESVTVELSLVEPLGWFLELEIIRDTDSRAGDAKQALLAVLEKAGIPETCIETRYYAEMLRGGEPV